MWILLNVRAQSLIQDWAFSFYIKIYCKLPVVAAAEKLQVSEEMMIRAVALSHLITIHIKSKFGRLSALCGVTAAGMGASRAIVYLLNGGLQQIKAAIQNTIGNVSGMICDGAKAGCAMKVSTCSNVAVQSALLALNHQEIKINRWLYSR